MSLRGARCIFLFTLLFSPSMFARGGDTAPKALLANDHVRITLVEIASGGALPVDSRFDMLAVKVGDADVPAAKRTKNPGGDVHYIQARSAKLATEAEPGTYVLVQFLRPQGKAVALHTPDAHYCNPGSQTACVREQFLFCAEHFCTEIVTLGVGAISTQHTHDDDHIVIPTKDFRWREEVAGKEGVDHDFKKGEPVYLDAGVTHRLFNDGQTTARMVVVQFK